MVLRAVTAKAFVVLAACLLAGPVSVAHAKSCGSFSAQGHEIKVTAKMVSCAKARKVIKEFWLAPEKYKRRVGTGGPRTTYLKRYPGWACGSGAGAGGCRKSKARADYVAI